MLTEIMSGAVAENLAPHIAVMCATRYMFDVNGRYPTPTELNKYLNEIDSSGRLKVVGIKRALATGMLEEASGMVASGDGLANKSMHVTKNYEFAAMGAIDKSNWPPKKWIGPI